jgi:Holliday junction resolvase RusA-like endonuclease
MTDTLRLELPFPPTVNNLFANGKPGKDGKRRRFMTPAYRKWREEAGWLVRDQIGAQRIAGPYLLTIDLVRPDNRLRDNSNYLKAVEDLLVWLKVTDDDSLNRRSSIGWEDDGPPCVVTITVYRGGEHGNGS